MRRPARRRLETAEPTGILGACTVVAASGGRPAALGPGIGGRGADPTSSPPPIEVDPNFSARNLPCATRASASARHTASKTLSIVAASRSSWSMRISSDDLPRSTGRLSANCRGNLR